MPSAISVVTLLTDFGDRDYFVASMKGVILNINSQARIVDLSHGVRPQDIEEGAHLLSACYHYFPDGTVHIAVVDPGVGTTRRALLVTTSRYFFLAPDNGILTYALEQETGIEVRAIENKQYRLDADGATFDGRDLFAPSAAWLTRGQPPGSYGPMIRDMVKLPVQAPDWKDGAMVGQIVYVDRFGNLISNLTPLQIKEVQGAHRRDTVTVRIGGATIEGLSPSYEQGEASEPHALINSNGRIEVYVKNGNAAERLGVGRGERISVL
ncbi:MAG TPA: SAM-dependent chlorinase/fluorinase [Nitrospirales bacterium]|nr:SAM-dependent chlorinase/fluorinase [Nitrospirales bacterium]